MRNSVGLAALGLVVACAGEPPASSSEDATWSRPAPATNIGARPLDLVALERGVAPVAVDDHGAPRLMRATRVVPGRGATPEAAARAHVADLAPAWGLGGEPAADLETAYKSPLRGGATMIALRQRVGGVEVYRGALRVLVRADRSLHAVSGTRVRAAGAPRAAAFRVDAAGALAIVLADRFAVTVPATQIAARRAHGDWQALTVPARPDLVVGPALARRVLVRDGGQLAAAWMVEVFAGPGRSADAAAWRVIVDAGSGAVRERIDLVAADAFTYRVFADGDAAGRPFDGPQIDFMPHPTGIPDGSQPAFIPPNLVTMDGFNASADPWLPAGATETIGNNVDAYVDLDGSADGLTAGDFRASITAPGAFDRTYDTAAGPMVSQAQQMAAITNLFYVNNWLHDWFYDSGFTEATGNAQADNLGRGGVGGDAILAEAQDNALGGSRNNANMSTPSDGTPPRMQMFLWSGASQRSLTAEPGGLSLSSGTAAFGPQGFDVTAQLVQADDGVGTATDGCEPIGAAVAGRIALIDRGSCTFAVKAANAGAAGAVGVIIGNVSTSANPTAAPTMNGSGTTPPALSVNLAGNTTLQAAIAAGPVTARLFRVTGLERDGDLDVTVVAHEWGHYLHHRLTECSSTRQCGAMSEGWADFVALLLALRPGDDAHQAFPIGVYDTVSLGDAYFGIRRAPYSVDLALNGLTFKHLQSSEPAPTGFPFVNLGSNAEVHNAGEVWASMMWEVYVALIDANGYAVARRRMTDYVVAGLQLAPTDQTITEMRDAILIAIAAIEPGDATIAAAAFARRGAGSCAVGPPAPSTSLNGVVEDFGVAGALRIGAITLAEVVTCDADGVLDAGETATLSIEVANAGAAALAATTIAVTSATPGVTILDGARPVAPLAPFSTTTLEVGVRLDVAVAAMTPIAIDVQLDDAGACEPSVAAGAVFLTGYDDLAAVSATDDVESTSTPWTVAGTDADTVWSRQPIPALTTAWLGVDSGSNSDTQLESPDLDVDLAAAFVVTLSHRYSFEFSGGTYWDGGVIELSTDAGASWQDITTYGVAPGYDGTLTTTSGNPLGGTAAFGATSPSYPDRDPLILDFGSQFAGQAVRLRFRIATDAGVGDYGWELDDLAFAGITNTPFGVLVDEGPTCQVGPIANAGADQGVLAGTGVTLDGTGSSDPNGDGLTYAWTQISGDPVVLTGADTAQPTYLAGDGPAAFRLTVSDPWASSTDDVDITIGEPLDGGGCCRTSRGPLGGAGGAIPPIALVAFALRRRRRARPSMPAGGRPSSG